ncbi:MAG TPA: SPW repeat protein [Thermoanaerobaculia bacterium]|nr:SPW repeat protein [Thermoanaerobaculia bacterium]
MRFIPTRVHGFLDYGMGLLLIAAPWLLGFTRGGAETWVPVILGAGVIVYSLMTDYELGVAPVISMPAHLWLDVLGGALLLVSPWLFGFSDHVWVPHVVFGVLEMGAGLFTSRVPARHAGVRPA